MKIIHKAFQFATVDTMTDGIFTGYASTFNNIDKDGDIILEGAFQESLAQKKYRLPLLWSHDHNIPAIGMVELTEDSHGLRIDRGILNLELALARDIYSNIKNGILDSFSIGFYLQKREYRDGVRYILQADIFEVSLVNFPANNEAKINNIKTVLKDIHNIRTCEEALRDVGFSQNDAKHFISLIKSHDYAQNDVLEQLMDINNTLKELT